MQLKTGTLLHGGTYRILNASEIIPQHKDTFLGQGSFGITYLAEHTSLGRKVAIKEFFMKDLNTRGDDGSISGMSDGSLSYNYGQKFKKEAINLSQLDHPNIVRVTDSFEENGTYYYVMDYIEGENLNDYLKHNAVSKQEAVNIITDVAKALQYMHDTKHILHLDLKPGNIMRRASDAHIFLIDFGLSKHYSSNGQPETSTTIGLGTPGYAPIEQSNQAKSGEFRPTIDVYALGATLYKLLTRETPPPAPDIVSDDELIEGKLRANGITGDIIDVVVNAMLPNVKKRTQTVKAFLNSLNSQNNASSNSQSVKSTPSNRAFADESTMMFGQENVSAQKSASVRTQAFNIDQYKIPIYFVFDAKDTERKAVESEPEAMFALAIMYLRGEGTSQDFDAAYRWLNRCKTMNGDGRAVAIIDNWEFLKQKHTNHQADNKTQQTESLSEEKKPVGIPYSNSLFKKKELPTLITECSIGIIGYSVLYFMLRNDCKNGIDISTNVFYWTWPVILSLLVYIYHLYTKRSEQFDYNIPNFKCNDHAGTSPLKAGCLSFIAIIILFFVAVWLCTTIYDKVWHYL
ncbi:MAG: protein kinase [Prevotellaceae bacterium]|nr:protein kinase [Candidatus Minthosoma equi]